MRADITARLARRLTPKDPTDARVRIELLRAVAQSYKSTTIANPVIHAIWSNVVSDDVPSCYEMTRFGNPKAGAD